jgi:hypothetical protein
VELTAADGGGSSTGITKSSGGGGSFDAPTPRCVSCGGRTDLGSVEFGSSTGVGSSRSGAGGSWPGRTSTTRPSETSCGAGRNDS